MKKKQVKEQPTKKQAICYLRVSTIEQDLEKNKADILKYANDRDFGKVIFIEEKVSGTKSWKERKIKNIINELGEGDKLIVPELSRMGRSMVDIMSCIAVAKEKGILIYDVKNGFELNGKFQGELMAMIFSIAAQIERDLISARTKEGLRSARAQGKLLGRPKGAGKSKLDPHKDEIMALLRNSVPKTVVAKKYGTAVVNLYNWILKNGLDVKARETGEMK